MNDGRALVSVVVPTRNSGRTIERCIASLRTQTWPAVELLVIDNWSSDGTWELASRLADVAVRAGPERSTQRNLGIARAAGEWVLWIDSDMMLGPEVVKRALAAGEAASATAVFVPEASTGSGFWARCRALERRCYRGEPRIESPRLVRTGYLRAAGGFDDLLVGTEDAALRNRLLADGVSLAWADTVIVHDEGRFQHHGSIAAHRGKCRAIVVPDYASSSAMVTIPSACESAIQVRHACSSGASATRASDLERVGGRSDGPPAKTSTH